MSYSQNTRVQLVFALHMRTQTMLCQSLFMRSKSATRPISWPLRLFYKLPSQRLAILAIPGTKQGVELSSWLGRSRYQQISNARDGNVWMISCPPNTLPSPNRSMALQRTKPQQYFSVPVRIPVVPRSPLAEIAIRNDGLEQSNYALASQYHFRALIYGITHRQP